MIPKAEEVLYAIMVTNPTGFHDDDSFKEQMSHGYGDQIHEAMKEYGRRLLDHVAEVAKLEYYSNMDNQWHELVIADPDDKLHRVDKQSILQIKDEL